MSAPGGDTLSGACDAGAYDEAIPIARELIAADRRALTDPVLKEWCGRRWRNIFISEASADPVAVDVASRRVRLPGTDLSVKAGKDNRPDRQRVAERFLRNAGEEWHEEMPEAQAPRLERTTLVFCPGLIGSIFPVPGFATAFAEVAERYGWRVVTADSHPMRSCAENIADLEAAIEPAERVFLLGYSKGCPDALTLLAERPGLAEKVAALISWGGAVGGSYLADDMYGTLAGIGLPGGVVGEAVKVALKAVFPVINLDEINRRFDEYDIGGAVNDLRTETRAAWMAEHGEAIDGLDIPIFNVTGATTALEVPYFQAQGYLQIARTDPDNDMQVTQEQAKVNLPMAADLATLNAHHWDMSYDALPVRSRLGSPNLEHRFPRTAAITTHFKLLGELGLID